MKNFFYKIIGLGLLLSLTITNANAVTKLSKGDWALKNYGFSYCLSKSDDTTMRFESGHAMGGYFQLGEHSQNAYDNVKSYINNYLAKNVSYYQDTDKQAILMVCLALYNSTGYSNLIKQQKNFIVK